MHTTPRGYFITFRSYGTWLPGDDRGFVHHTPDRRGAKARAPKKSVLRYAKSRQTDESRVLSRDERETVEHAIRGVCTHRDWTLVAINVRSNHVHVVVQAATEPERVMRDFKAWSTRRLREAKFAGPEEKIWARHGSTIYLFEDRELAYAVWYTNEAQEGERFEVRDPPS